jgi:hypothetical protein
MRNDQNLCQFGTRVTGSLESFELATPEPEDFVRATASMDSSTADVVAQDRSAHARRSRLALLRVWRAHRQHGFE